MLVTAPILAGLVNLPNSIMRLASPFTIFLVLVFALLVSAGGPGSPKYKPTLPTVPEDEVVSYSSSNMIQPKVRYSIIKIHISKHRRDDYTSHQLMGL